MSVYRGEVLIAAGGRDVNPSSILAGQNIERTVSPDDNCVTIATCDCVCFEEVCAACNLVTPNIVTDCIYCCDGTTPYFQNYVTSPGCCGQKICCLTEADYQALVLAGTVNADTYYFTCGSSAVSGITEVCFGAGLNVCDVGTQRTVSNPYAVTWDTTNPVKIGTWIGGVDLYKINFCVPTCTTCNTSTRFGCSVCNYDTYIDFSSLSATSVVGFDAYHCRGTELYSQTSSFNPGALENAYWISSSNCLRLHTTRTLDSNDYWFGTLCFTK